MLRRRRLFGRRRDDSETSLDTPDDSREALVADGSGMSLSEVAEGRVVPVLMQRKEKHHHSHSIFSRRRFLFPFALLLGVLIGFILISPSSTPYDLPAQFSLILEQYNIPSLADGFNMLDVDWSRFEVEWQNIRNMIPEPWKLANDGREFQVGEEMKERGLKANYPVVLVPGVISTSLESWSTTPEFRPYFREKLWGGLGMVSHVTFNRERWMNSLLLDPETGLDPPGVKVRAAQGLDAASSFIQGYWVWAKIIENLAVVDYDTANNLFLAAYDWRLSYSNLEVRDAYFSRLKTTIESLRKRHEKKTVLVGHSMGSTVILYFFKWVESPDHGAGGPTWVEDHIEAFVSVAGTILGVPKALTAFLSGEMKDTVELNPAGAYVLERFFSRNERAKLFRSWAGSASMWVKGGDAIWGNGTHAPDDPDNCTQSHGRFLSFRPESAQEHNQHILDRQREANPNGTVTDEPESDCGDEGKDPCADVIVAQSHDEKRSDEQTRKTTGGGNMTVEEATMWILQHTPVSFQKMLEANYSVGIERDEAELKRNDFVEKTWTNPLESRLPLAPSMKIFCVYGHGKETERSYWYARGPYVQDDIPEESKCAAEDDSCVDRSAKSLSSHELPIPRRNWIDAEVNDLGNWPKVKNGVKMGEGDGTVSLLSLGAMCVEGWKRKTWNPAGINVTTIELPHRPSPTMPRGGANTSEHIDILGSTMLNEIILKVATGVGHEVQESIVSNIKEYVKRMQWD